MQPLNKKVEVGDIVRLQGTGEHGSLWAVQTINEFGRAYGRGITPIVFPEAFSHQVDHLEVVMDGRMLHIVTDRRLFNKGYDELMDEYDNWCDNDKAQSYFGTDGYCNNR